MAQTEARHKSQVEELTAHLAQTEARHKSQVEELTAHLAQTEARHKSHVEELTGHYNREIGQLRERVAEINELLHDRSVNLAESEARGEELRSRLVRQLKTAKRLRRLLDEADSAAARLRSSARWQLTNPVAALKAKLGSSKDSLGYGHLEKVISTVPEVANYPARCRRH